MKPMIVAQFSAVGKSYSSGIYGKPVPALIDFSLDLAAGEIYGIVGANGAGKSTALKILLGFITADSGTTSLFGQSSATASIRGKIGYLPEISCLYESLTIREHLKFVTRIMAGKKSLIDQFMPFLEKVNLLHVVDKPIRGFSKGMAQRAALALALFHEPELLVLDEPMSGLDPLGRQMVVDIISDYNREGKTVLFCSHILSDVERMCDKIALLHLGRLHSVITPDELLKNYPPENISARKSPLETFFLNTVTSLQRQSSSNND
jgi:ABC-2 type transport system ATP-binding protein